MKLTLCKSFVQKEGWKLLNIEGGVAANVVPRYAKAELFADDKVEIVEAEGVSAHASTPQHGENAIGKLCLKLKEMPLAEEAKKAIEFVADKLGMDYTGKAFGVNFSDEPSGPVTLNLGMISLRTENNETKLQIVLDSRCPVTFGYDDLVPLIKNTFISNGWEVVEESWSDSIYRADDSEIVQKLLGVYRKITGDMTPAFCIGGGTYAKDIPNILAFGAEKKDDDHCIHGADEFIFLDQMIESGLIFAEAMKALSE
jgi:succinyl-diaminopimelate desuccinylase